MNVFSLAVCAAILSCGAAYADSAVEAPVSTSAQDTNAVTTGVGSPATPPTPPSTSAPLAPAPGATSSLNGLPQEPIAGPLQEQRYLLLKKIHEAKQHGIGVSAYAQVYRSIEDLVKSGASDDVIAKRVESLASGLQEQLKRSQQLKTQKPAPPVAGSPEAAKRSSSHLSGEDIGRLADQLGNTGLGNLPPSLLDQLPPGITPDMAAKFLQSPEGKQMLKKLK